MEQRQISINVDPREYVITQISKLSPLTKCPSIIVRVLSKQVNSKYRPDSSSQADNQQQNLSTKTVPHYGSQSSCTLELVDQSKEVIQLFLYGEEQMETIGKQLTEQCIYHLFNFSVKSYSNDLFPKQHFKLTYNKTSAFLQVDEDNSMGIQISSQIPKYFLDYQSLAEIEKENTPVLLPQVIDTAGVVIHAIYSEIDIAKGGGGKLVLLLQDADNSQMWVTLWQNLAQQFQKVKKYQILLLRNMKAVQFQTKIQLSSLPSSQIFYEPDCEVSPFYVSLLPIRDSIIKLREEHEKNQLDKSKPGNYAQNIPINAAFSNGNPQIAKINYNQSAYQSSLMSKPSTNLSEVEKKAKENLFGGQLIQMSSFTKAIFKSLSSKVHYYYTCPKCSKRVENASVINCPFCKNDINPLPKLILSIIIADETNQILCTCFSEEAALLLERSAENVIQIIQDIEKATSDSSQVSQCIKEAFSSQYEKCFLFKILSRLEEFNGQRKISHKIQKLFKEDKNNIIQSSAVSGDYDEDISSQTTGVKPENDYPLSQ